MSRYQSKGSSFTSQPCSNCGQYHNHKQEVLNKLKNTHIFKFKDIYVEEMSKYTRQQAQKIKNQDNLSTKSHKEKNEPSRIFRKQDFMRKQRNKSRVKVKVNEYTENTVRKVYNKIYQEMINKTKLKRQQQSRISQYKIKPNLPLSNSHHLQTYKVKRRSNDSQNSEQIHFNQDLEECQKIKQINSFVYDESISQNKGKKQQKYLMNGKKIQNQPNIQIYKQKVQQIKDRIQDIRRNQAIQSQYKTPQPLQSKQDTHTNKILMEIPKIQDCQTFCGNLSWKNKICGYDNLKEQNAKDKQTQTFLLEIYLDNWK